MTKQIPASTCFVYQKFVLDNLWIKEIFSMSMPQQLYRSVIVVQSQIDAAHRLSRRRGKFNE